MHGDGRRRLRVRVSCGVYADTSALLAFGLGSVAGASTPMRDDSIADEHTDGAALINTDRRPLRPHFYSFKRSY